MWSRERIDSLDVEWKLSVCMVFRWGEGVGRALFCVYCDDGR